MADDSDSDDGHSDTDMDSRTAMAAFPRFVPPDALKPGADAMRHA
jgi:hypothetical protein